MRIAVACTGHALLRDAAAGLKVCDELRKRGIDAVELYSDAIAMVDDLARLNADKLILVGAVQRGGRPGDVRVYRYVPEPISPTEASDVLRPSLDGRVSLEDLLNALRIFPLNSEIWVVECEPFEIWVSDELSDKCREVVGRLVEEVIKLINVLSA